MDFSQALVNGIPLLLVVWGLVAFLKSLGMTGTALTGASLAVGLALGIAYQVSTAGLPVGFNGWFGVVIYGLGLGIVASGLYDVVKRDFLKQPSATEWLASYVPDGADLDGPCQAEHDDGFVD